MTNPQDEAAKAVPIDMGGENAPSPARLKELGIGLELQTLDALTLTAEAASGTVSVDTNAVIREDR